MNFYKDNLGKFFRIFNIYIFSLNGGKFYCQIGHITHIENIRNKLK
jgi:hypothetical protein